MSLVHYLFGFSGRINRAKQWAVLLVSLVHAILLGVAFSLTVGGAAVIDVAQGKTSIAAFLTSPQVRQLEIIFCVLAALSLYIGLAVAIKRLHDRDKSAWWVLVFFVLPLVFQIPVLMYLPVLFHFLGDVINAAQHHLPPPRQPYEPPLVIISRGAASILSLWAFVELYCLRGTVGDNRFGPDPLAGKA